MKDLCKMEKCPRLFLVFAIFTQLLFDLFVGVNIAINYGIDTGGFLIAVTMFCIAIIATIIYEVE